jgi:hypothetical protein
MQNGCGHYKRRRRRSVNALEPAFKSWLECARENSQLAMNRRHFLKQAGLATGGIASGALVLSAATNHAVAKRIGKFSAQPSTGLVIVLDPADPIAAATPTRWAVEQLKESLARRQVGTQFVARIAEAAAGLPCLVVSANGSPQAKEILAESRLNLYEAPESLGLVPGKSGGRPVLAACGIDSRGLTYALLELADRVTHAEHPLAAFAQRRPIIERPANKIRSVMRVFASDVEDKSWYYDRSFWRRYLTMLAAERFNRFSLALGLGYDFTSGIRDAYFHFAYPFLVTVPGYVVRVTGVSEAERERNLDMLRFISGETAVRGMHFQLGLWTHAYRWTNSPNANHIIEGLSPDKHAAYCREALRALLTACPAISGVTFRIHGESGVAEGNYEFWKTVFAGAVDSGRRVEIDMHAKGMDAEMIDVALATGLPVNISPKFWAEHMGLSYHQAAIRPTEMPPRGRKDEGFFSRSSGSRSYLRYGYGDLLAEGRRYGVLHRIWPGTQRLLLWGDPALAAGFGRASSFCGSAGVEIFEPLSFKGRKGSGLPGGRDAYAEAALKPAAGDFEKYSYSYRLWGRLLYNPDTEPEVWQRQLVRQNGRGAKAVEAALASASRILPLFTTAHLPSAANNNFWPEIYTNMPIVDANRKHPYGDTPSPKRFGTVSPLDPQLFSRVDDFAAELVSGERSGKYSPLEVAEWLQVLAENAARQVAKAATLMADEKQPAFRRLSVDVALQSGLGRFFGQKLRAGVLYALHERTGNPRFLDEALAMYRSARETWAQLAGQAEGIYVTDITFGLEPHLRGHWRDRLPAIDQDIADMEARLQALSTAPASSRAVSQEIQRRISRALSGKLARPNVSVRHVPPEHFRRGRPLTVSLATPLGSTEARSISARMFYRHTNQAEEFRSEVMQLQSATFQATIPATYTDSPYPLQYYFEFRRGPDQAWLHPGFTPDLSNQPYYIVRQAV